MFLSHGNRKKSHEGFLVSKVVPPDLLAWWKILLSAASGRMHVLVDEFVQVLRCKKDALPNVLPYFGLPPLLESTLNTFFQCPIVLPKFSKLMF